MPLQGELYILTSDENIYAMPCGDLCTSDEGAASAGVTTSILEDAASVSPDSASTTEDSLLTCLEQADEEPTYQVSAPDMYYRAHDCYICL